MPDDGSSQSKTTWPIAKFSFEARWDNTLILCQEVSGLEVEDQVIEYRHGKSLVFDVSKMPGIQKTRNVSLKKGIFKSDSTLWAALDDLKLNTIKRTQLTITLIDAQSTPLMMWILANARPIKISGTDLRAGGDEVAVDMIEFAHEGVTIVYL